MASSQSAPMLVVLTFITAAALQWQSCYSTSKVYTVGDSAGWGLGVDYNTWAQAKNFKVGDSLVFNYPIGHTVDMVSKTDYDSCTDGNAVSTDSSGATTIVLRSPGTHYFICGGTGHCVSGMKLAIKVTGSSSSSSPGGGGSSGSTGGGGGTRTGSGGRSSIIYAPPPPPSGESPSTTNTYCPPTITTPTPPISTTTPGQGVGYGSYEPPASSYDGYSNAPSYSYSPTSTTPFPYYYAPPYEGAAYGSRFSTSSSSSLHLSSLSSALLLTVTVARLGAFFITLIPF